MGEYSGRKAVDGREAVPKRGSCITYRNSIKSRDHTIQFCNRIGCSGRLNPWRDELDGAKALKSSSGCFKHGKEATGNSSKAVRKVTNPVIPSSARCGSTISHTQMPKVPNSSSLSNSTHRSVQLDHKKAKRDGSSSVETGSPSAVSNISAKRNFLKRPSSVVDSSISSRTSSNASKISSQLSKQNASATRPGSRRLNCSSAPSVSPSDSLIRNRKQVLNRNSERVSSSSPGVKKASLTEDTARKSSKSGISVSETRQARNTLTSFKDNVSSTSARARRLDTSTIQRPPQVTRFELPTDERGCRLPNSQSTTGNPLLTPTFTRSSTTETSRRWNLPSSSGVPYCRNLANLEDLRHYSLSEVLDALDQIEHDDEDVSLEGLRAMESNFVLSALSFHDQHRDMRLDIDNMSYEELLALEERIGYVSTALSEDALANCIKKSVYKPCSSITGFLDMDGVCVDDTKCSICQEEYGMGDEMGRLQCKHSYHVDCIGQWLRQKNWCPICKSSAAS